MVAMGWATWAGRPRREERDRSEAAYERFAAAMEREHMEILSRRYHLEPFAPGAVMRIDQAAIYAGATHVPDDPASLFRLAIAFERRAAEFFTERETSWPEGSPERKLYRELAEEEREHVDLLGTEYARWKEGKPGLL